MAKAEKKKLSGRKRDERVAAYIFVAPAVILLIAFLVVPMIYTVYFSGFKYQIMRPDAMKFIGLENYQKLFSDKNFWLALKNTVYFTVIVVPCQCVLALALALLVSKKFRGVAVFRTMYFAPQLTSMVVISVLWSVLYNANPNTGLINSILVSLGMDTECVCAGLLHHLYVCMAGRRLSDDDLPGRSSGNPERPVRSSIRRRCYKI